MFKRVWRIDLRGVHMSFMPAIYACEVSSDSSNEIFFLDLNICTEPKVESSKRDLHVVGVETARGGVERFWFWTKV